MKAIVCTKYGSPNVLHFIKTEKATPKGNEIFRRVYAASANAADCHLLGGAPPDNRKGRGELNYETDPKRSVSFI